MKNIIMKSKLVSLGLTCMVFISAISFNVNNVYAAPVITPIGNPKENNYWQYEQPVDEDDNPTSEIVDYTFRFPDSTKGYSTTSESGYEQFKSTIEPINYSSLFLKYTNISSRNHTLSKNSTINLPVSCIESAQWVMNCIRLNQAIDYNPDDVNSLDYDIYAYGLKSNNVAGYSLNSRKGIPGIVADIGASSANSFSYEDEYNVGDGIIAIDLTNKDYPFHAVSIVAKVGKEIIVIERNAGNTVMPTGHLGDNKWVLNTYGSVNAFANSLCWGKNTLYLKLSVDPELYKNL